MIFPESFNKCLLLCGVSLSAFHVNAEGDWQEEIVMVSTRTEQSQFDSLFSVSVVDEQAIAKYLPNDIGEILETLASIDVVRTGSAGSATSVQTRGTNSDHTLILINGQRFNSATLGATQFNLIDPALIERVEFVRGSRSALYGSDAIAGVINITTKQASEESETFIIGEYGSHNLQRVSLGNSNTVDAFSYSVGLAHVRQDGFDSLVDDTGFNADEDGFKNTNANVHVGYRWDDIEVSFNHFQTKGENDYDSAFSPNTQPYIEASIALSGVHLILPFNDSYTSSLSLSRSSDESEEFDHQSNTGANSYFETARTSLFWQNDVALNDDHLLTFGVDHMDEEVETSALLSETERSNTAPFVQLQSDFDRLDVLLGYRSDDNDSYGTHDTGSLALGYEITEGLKIFGSWAQGFKAPTFNDLFWPESVFSAGNIELEPESSDNVELGLKGHVGELYWELLVFDNEVENLIDWAPDENSVWRPTNIASAEFKGFEASFDVVLNTWTVEGSYSYVSSQNTDTGEVLENRSKSKFVVNIEQEWDALRYGLTVKHQGEREASPEPLDAYTLLSVYIHYDVITNLALSTKINNITDEEYQLNSNYNQDGINGSLKVKYVF